MSLRISFVEVFGGLEHMNGGVADTLLVLVWTQYQSFVLPLVLGVFGLRLLRENWRRCPTEAREER